MDVAGEDSRLRARVSLGIPAVNWLAKTLSQSWPDSIDVILEDQDGNSRGISRDLALHLQDEGLIMFEAISIDQYGNTKLQDAALTRKGQLWARSGLYG